MIVRATVESVVRALIQILITVGAIEIPSTDVEKVIGAFVIVIALIASIYSSVRTHIRNLRADPTNAPPKKAGGPPPSLLMMVIAVPVVYVLLGGCASHQSLGRVAGVSASGVEIARIRHAETARAGRALLGALIESERITDAARIHGAMVGDGFLIPAGSGLESDPDALEAAVQSGSAEPGPLVSAIRSGALTLEAGRAWIRDYALIRSASDGRTLGRTMIERLPEVRASVEAGEFLLGAWDDWVAETDAVLAEIRDGLHGSASLADSSLDASTFPAVFGDAILSAIPGDRRGDASRALDLIFDRENPQ